MEHMETTTTEHATEHMTCHFCGKPINEEEAVEVRLNSGETARVCPECLKTENVFTCHECGDVFESGEQVVTADGDPICESCYIDKYFICEYCGDIHHVDEARYITDISGYYCERCSEYHAYTCERCGELTSENYGDNDTYLCEDCRDNHYIICERCDNVVPRSEARYYDREGYCETCYEQVTNRGIHDYNYKPTPIFHHTDEEAAEKKRLYLGIELEMGGLDERSDCNDLAEELNDEYGESGKHFYLKKDGSIPCYGFELVTHPMTIGYHKEFHWKELLSKCIDGGMRSHDLGGEGCGLHVHLSRRYFTNFQLVKLDYLIQANKEKFEKLARRSNCHWAKFKNPKVTWMLGKSSSDRYQAVNFQNRSTVELRLFRGTLKYSTFIATLELADAIGKWAVATDCHDIITEGTWGSFIGFVAKHNNEYRELIDYMSERGV